MKHGSRITLAGLVFVALTMGFDLSTSASPAGADNVGQCVGPFWGYLTQSVCVHVVTGAKNYGNHTEWVASVEVDEFYPYTLLEAWGSNFYFQGYGTARIWSVNRWEPSGSGVCGAYVVIGSNNVREIACISIKV